MLKYILLLLFDFFLIIGSPSTMDKGFMTLCVILALLKFVFLINEGKSKYNDLSRMFFRHSVVFVFCILIVFFQCDLDYIIGLADINDYFVYEPKVVCPAMALSNMALSSFLVGYCYYKNTEKRFGITGHNYANYKLNKKYLVAIAFLLIGLYVYFIPKDYLDLGYNKVSAGAVGIIIGYLISVFIAIYVLYYMEYMKENPLSWYKHYHLPLIISGVYAFIIIITGRRTEVVQVGFIILASYVFVKGAKANHRFILIAGTVGMLILGLIGIYRSLEGGTILESYNALNSQKSILPPTKELSTSVVTFHIALANYPDIYPFNYGSSFFPAFFKIIPGLSGLLSMLGLTWEGSDMIITSIYFGKQNIIYGLGSSILADIYISFGAIGILLIFFILGVFIRWLEVGTFSKQASPYFLALSFSCYSEFMFACRNGIGIFFLCWTYSCLLIYLFSHVVNRKIYYKRR